MLQKKKNRDHQPPKQSGLPGRKGPVAMTGPQVSEVSFSSPVRSHRQSSNGWMFYMRHQDRGDSSGQQIQFQTYSNHLH